MSAGWRPRRPELLAALVAFVLAAAGAFWLHHGASLYDTDAAYHLAIARAYANEGTIDGLRWARFSVMADGFGDKEWLFHVLLAPLAAAEDPEAGGRWALVIAAAALAAAVAFVAARAVGVWGWAVPLWLFFASTELAWRLVRLRPELLSLLLLLATVWAAAAGRERLLGVLGALYALSYTAFHAFLGLSFLYFFYFGWSRRRWPWKMALYPLLGVGVGLLLHPHFPKNLEIWVIQNVSFFVERGGLNVGSEIRPNFTDVSLMVNLGWLLGLAVLWRSRVKHPQPPAEDDRRQAEVLGITAFVFVGLYLLMSRFSLYAIPLTTLWLLWEIRRRGDRVGGWVALPGRGRIPLAVAMALCLAVSLPEASRQLQTFRARTDPGPNNARLHDRQALARALPEGARVVADWGSTPIYMLWAPQGRYLNVLDPVFMLVANSERYRVLRDIFTGREPEIPLLSQLDLDSDHIAFARATADPRLAARLAADPRVEPLHLGSHALYRFRSSDAASFVLDWRVLPRNLAPPVARDVDITAWASFPRVPAAIGGELQGYVDVRRLGREQICTGFVHRLTLASGVAIEYELAPYGAAELWIDGELAARLEGEMAAILGKGLIVPIKLTAGDHQLTVVTCPAAESHGFYLLERRRQPWPAPARSVP